MPYFDAGDDMRIWYRQSGPPTAPALLLLHGFTGNGAVWRPLAAALRNRYTLIIPDLPGHGRTAAPANPDRLAMARTAADLWNLLNHLNIAETAVLGYSMGGRLALHVAARDPARVRGLILESASPGIDDAEARLARRSADCELANRIEAQGLDWFLDYWESQPLFASHRRQSGFRCRQQRRIRAANSAAGLAQSLRGAGTGGQPSLWTALPSLTVPVLVVVGADDTKFRSIGEAMVSRLRHARLAVMAGAGHTPHWECPRAYRQLVAEFLDRLEPPARQPLSDAPHSGDYCDRT